jgi:hypothetical protein
MPASHDDNTLELLLSEASESNPDPIVLLPQAPGSGTDAIARSLSASIEKGRWRLFPAPAQGAGVLAQRAWHRDLWLAMPQADRDSVALVTGATAGYLGPVLGDVARTVVLVRGPLAAVRVTGEALPKKRTLESLEKTPADQIPARLRRVANPQSRALLAPWHDPAELVLSMGPPGDADRWREALFGDVLPHLDASAIELAPSVARALAESLGGRAKPVVQAAKAIADDTVPVAEDPAQDELLLRLNWLDAELYERCIAPSRESG